MHLYNITLCFLSRSQYIIGCIFLISPEICPTSSYNLPDQTNFLEIRGVYHPPPILPPGVWALVVSAKVFLCIDCRISYMANAFLANLRHLIFKLFWGLSDSQTPSSVVPFFGIYKFTLVSDS